MMGNEATLTVRVAIPLVPDGEDEQRWRRVLAGLNERAEVAAPTLTARPDNFAANSAGHTRQSLRSVMTSC
ncbi:hypothetical protein ACWGK1_37840 [Streptomyces wedmorensis]